MGVASKVVCVILRLGEMACSLIVLGIIGRFLAIVSDANIYSDSRLVYTTVVASISTFLSLALLLPFTYSFLAFPMDFVMAVLWLVAFCLLEALTGVNTCNAVWYWSYWGYYWGGLWRTPIVVSGPVDIGWSGCSSWRTVLAFTFINSFLFFCSAVLGTAVILKYHGEKRHLRELAEQDAKTRKPPQAGPENLQVQSELPSMSRP